MRRLRRQIFYWIVQARQEEPVQDDGKYADMMRAKRGVRALCGVALTIR